MYTYCCVVKRELEIGLTSRAHRDVHPAIYRRVDCEPEAAIGLLEVLGAVVQVREVADADHENTSSSPLTLSWNPWAFSANVLSSSSARLRPPAASFDFGLRATWPSSWIE